MKGKKHNSKSNRKGNNKGNGNGKGCSTKQNESICLLFESEKKIHVLAIDTNEEGTHMYPLSKLPHPGSPRVGFAALGSKIYVIGGNIDLYGATYPKDVYFCDFDCNPKEWRKGPPLKGGKPNPVVVTVHQKIYALAGYSIGRSLLTEKIDPVFEVLDPKFGDVWTPLPNPPFLSLYPKDYLRVDFRGHTVIGSNIYVQLAGRSGRKTLYSFNVIKEEWKVHDGGDSSATASAGSDDLIINNLRLGGWFLGADVVDYLLYQTALDVPGKGVKVYAYDLAASKQDEEEDVETFHDDESSICLESSYEADNYCFPDDDYLVTVPVVGLNHVTDTISTSMWMKAFVAHLRDNLFCLICYYNRSRFENGGQDRTFHVRACTFKAIPVEVSKGSKFIKRYLEVEDVKEADWVIDKKLGKFTSWCKIPNMGLQIHFRRPQFQHEGKSNSYQDDVAAKLVRKGNRFDDQVREMNISPHDIAELQHLTVSNLSQEDVASKMLQREETIVPDVEAVKAF